MNLTKVALKSLRNLDFFFAELIFVAAAEIVAAGIVEIAAAEIAALAIVAAGILAGNSGLDHTDSTLDFQFAESFASSLLGTSWRQVAIKITRYLRFGKTVYFVPVELQAYCNHSHFESK